MLPKTWRVSKKEFAEILSKGKRYNSPHFLLYCIEDTKAGSKNSRFAFSVSKKVGKTAVQRNRLRRQGYSVIQRAQKDVSSGKVLFFSFKKGSESLKFESIDREIRELLYVSGVVS